MNELPPLNLEQGLRIWQENTVSQPDVNHLDAETLQRFADKGGLHDADEQALEHLSRCPQCLASWAALCRSTSPAHEYGVADDWYSGGVMEAASSKGSGEPITSPSSCGRFLLTLYPDAQGSASGMITLEVTGAAAGSLEKNTVRLRDRAGTTFLDGTIIRNRLARRTDILQKIDLHTWSIKVKPVSGQEGK